MSRTPGNIAPLPMVPEVRKAHTEPGIELRLLALRGMAVALNTVRTARDKFSDMVASLSYGVGMDTITQASQPQERSDLSPQ